VSLKDRESMTGVVVLLKVLPADLVDFEDLKKAVLEKVDAKKVEVEPIAFGLKALNITVVLEDAEGGTDKLEETLKSLPQVGDVRVEGIGRL